MSMDWSKHIEATRQQEVVVIESVREVALTQVRLEHVRKDRTAAPAAVSDAAIAFRAKEADMAKAVEDLRELHLTAMRALDS